MLGGATKPSPVVLKYDQTGEPLQEQDVAEEGEAHPTPAMAAASDDDGGRKENEAEEMTCSVLTPEQIFSQLSRVLHTRGPSCSGEDAAEIGEQSSSDTQTSSRRSAAAANVASRKIIVKTKRARERKARKTEPQKKARTSAVETRKQEKRPRRRQRPAAGEATRQRTPPSTSNEASGAGGAAVHVVEISPPVDRRSLSASLRRGTRRGNGGHISSPKLGRPDVSMVTPNSLATADRGIAATVTTPSNLLGNPACGKDKQDGVTNVSPFNQISQQSKDNLGMAKSSEMNSKSTLLLNGTPLLHSADALKLSATKTSTQLCCHHDNKCCKSWDYELLGRLIGEPVLTAFYRSYHSHPLSRSLEIKYLNPLPYEGSKSPENSTARATTRWLQITRQRMHIDLQLGPVSLARILVSNTGIVKFQHLFPVVRTIFVNHVNGCDMTKLLSELSPSLTLCPGLQDYPANHTALGYHPHEVRIHHTSIVDSRRYDHRECPVIHVADSSPAQSNARCPENMCQKCSHLQWVIDRMLAKPFIPSSQSKTLATTSKTTTTSTSKASIWTRKSKKSKNETKMAAITSNPLPLNTEEVLPSTSAHATTLDKSATQGSDQLAPRITQVAMETEEVGTPNLATYYMESTEQQRLISTLLTSPSLSHSLPQSVTHSTISTTSPV